MNHAFWRRNLQHIQTLIVLQNLRFLQTIDDCVLNSRGCLSHILLVSEQEHVSKVVHVLHSLVLFVHRALATLFGFLWTSWWSFTAVPSTLAVRLGGAFTLGEHEVRGLHVRHFGRRLNGLVSLHLIFRFKNYNSKSRISKINLPFMEKNNESDAFLQLILK